MNFFHISPGMEIIANRTDLWGNRLRNWSSRYSIKRVKPDNPSLTQLYQACKARYKLGIRWIHDNLDIGHFTLDTRSVQTTIWGLHQRAQLGARSPTSLDGSEKMVDTNYTQGVTQVTGDAKNAFGKKNWMGKFLIEPLFLIWWSGGCFLRLNLSSFTYEALYYNKQLIDFQKICVVWKDFFLSLNLGPTASF